MNKHIITVLTLLSLFANVFAQDIVVGDSIAVDDNNDNLALLAHDYAIPDGGTLISSKGLLNRYATTKGRTHSFGTFSKAAEESIKGEEVVDVDITSEPGKPWDVQIFGKIETALKKGDTLFITLLARTLSAHDEAGDGKLTVFTQLNRAPHSKFLYNTINVGRKWTRIHYPFKADRDYAAGTAAYGLMLGYRIQKIQIAEFKLYNYGQKKNLKEFPVTKATYSGQAKDAPWRKEAAERIDTYRKADLNVVVKNSSGQPINNAEVQVNQTRHAFHFGSAISARALMSQDDNGKKYRKVVEECFTMVVFENDLKWPSWENPKNRRITMDAIKWIESRKIPIRGHCLIWPSWKRTPRDLKGLKDTPDALVKRINDHITDELSTLKGRIYEWDVINEPYTNHDVMDVLGQDSMISWFKQAKQTDPKPRLFLNDYSILSAGGTDKAHQDHYENTIQYMVDGDAPISGIGLQSHFGTDLTPPTKVYKLLERFSKFKLPLAITEHDINSDDQETQADYTRDFMTICFSHPNVDSFLSWGFWAGRHWRPNAAYFDKEWNLTPAGKIWINMFNTEWRTNKKLSTDASGSAKSRAFLGDYTITVTHEGKSVKKNAKVTKAGATVEITL